MLQELTHYDKFVGPIDAESSRAASRHFESLGMTTRILSSPESAELAKLTETTYFGLLIAWAQEVERYCDSVGADYDEVVAFYEEVGYLPPVKFVPGIIGGHCVMPNIEILKEIDDTPLLQAVRWSNEEKIGREDIEPRPGSGARFLRGCRSSVRNRCCDRRYSTALRSLRRSSRLIAAPT